MSSYRRLVAVGLLGGALLAAGPALAQERGRTDGPENSEWGKGGYKDPSGGRFSLQLDWGGAFPEVGDNPPLFVGGTASYWMDDWFLVDGSVNYLFNAEWFEVLVGPRFRTPGMYPVSFWLGLKAGPIFLPGSELRFGLSPQAGFDFQLEKFLLGLGYAADFALGEGDDPSHRVFMSIGYRF